LEGWKQSSEALGKKKAANGVGRKQKVNDVMEGKWVIDFKNEELIVSSTFERLNKMRTEK
jgi:hypothetical protein